MSNSSIDCVNLDFFPRSLENPRLQSRELYNPVCQLSATGVPFWRVAVRIPRVACNVSFFLVLTLAGIRFSQFWSRFYKTSSHYIWHRGRFRAKGPRIAFPHIVAHPPLLLSPLESIAPRHPIPLPVLGASFLSLFLFPMPAVGRRCSCSSVLWQFRSSDGSS